MKGLPSKEEFTAKAVEDYRGLLNTKCALDEFLGDESLRPGMAFLYAIDKLYEWLETREPR